jgi:GMP synthase-like glutamine amidotransferase
MTAAGSATCLVVQHVEPEGPYTLAESLAAAGIDVDVRQLFRGDPLPASAAGLDALVIMGGPMSAASDDAFPTRGLECDLIADAVARRVPTLGICLGAQLLALATGGRVHPGAAGPEIGWAPIRTTAAAGADRLFASASAELTVLHWHGDTFDLPPTAVLLAGSATYDNQAFRLGESAWGLQFHIEVDEAAVKVFVTDFEDEALRAGQDPQQIADRAADALDRLAEFRTTAFDAFADLVTARSRATTRVVNKTTQH